MKKGLYLLFPVSYIIPFSRHPTFNVASGFTTSLILLSLKYTLLSILPAPVSHLLCLSHFLSLWLIVTVDHSFPPEILSPLNFCDPFLQESLLSLCFFQSIIFLYSFPHPNLIYYILFQRTLIKLRNPTTPHALMILNFQARNIRIRMPLFQVKMPYTKCLNLMLLPKFNRSSFHQTLPSFAAHLRAWHHAGICIFLFFPPYPFCHKVCFHLLKAIY